MLPRSRFLALLVLVTAIGAGACSQKNPPVARPTPPPPAMTTAPRPPAPPEPVSEPTPVTVPPEPEVASSDIGAGSLDDINKRGALRPVFFDFDSAEVNAESQGVLSKNAEILKTQASWVVSIEGHCDERGTAEYNLALGERRALSVRTYLVSLGLAPDRLRTVSYGKEFPFDPGHSEDAWARNRRAHFVVTAK